MDNCPSKRPRTLHSLPTDSREFLRRVRLFFWHAEHPPNVKMLFNFSFRRVEQCCVFARRMKGFTQFVIPLPQGRHIGFVLFGQGLTPFDTTLKKGSGATPLTTQDL